MPPTIFGAQSATKIETSSGGVRLPPTVSDPIWVGDAARPGQFPYVVSLRLIDPGETSRGDVVHAYLSDV